LSRNAAELARLVDLKDRRRIVLPPTRSDGRTPGLDQAACAIVTGNRVTVDTYAHARLPLYDVPAVAMAEHDSPAGKDFALCRSRFVGLGGRGLVHAGMDRVLEAFAALPATQLTVCADLSAERDFERAYAVELYRTPHISTIGPLDVAGSRFRQVARDSVAMVFASCSEGQAPEVIAGMAAGLIPVVTRESGVDVDDCGLLLGDASVDAIRRAVETILGLPSQRLSEMSLAAWKRAAAHHSPAAARRRYEQVLDQVIEAHASR
jgi:glycosyltransferase involved in cell wall biosynthesis